MRKRTFVTLLLVVGCLAILIAFVAFLTPSHEIQLSKIRGIIYISIDALRADHLGCYGYKRNTSPFIDRFSGEAFIFQNAYVAWPKTTPSFAAIFTGLYGKTNGVVRHVNLGLPPNLKTFVQELKRAHVQTAGFTANSCISKEYGFNRGFDTYEDMGIAVPAPDQAEIVLFQLKKFQKDRPFFLFVHFLGPHAPYTCPKEYREMFLENDFYRTGKVLTSRKIPQYAKLDDRKELDYYISQYDGKIRYYDDAIGKLLAGIKREGYFDNCLIVITTDHGESLGEHGVYFEHGLDIHNDTVRVPLLIRYGGLPKRTQVVDTPVSLIDLAPTFLQAMGIKTSMTMQGVSLLPILLGKEISRDYIFAEAGYSDNYQRALISGKWKLVYVPDEKDQKKLGVQEFSLYDLSRDPGERKNVLKTHFVRGWLLKRKLLRWIQKDICPPNLRAEAFPVDISEETRENLRALGYIQ